MDRFDILFQKRLHEFVNEQLNKLYAGTAHGMANWDVYQRAVGRIEAFEAVANQCEAIRQQMIGGDERPRPN